MKRPAFTRRKKERGAALVLVVWAVGLMSVFAATAARDSSLDNLDARLVRGDVIARFMAEGGLRQAAQMWRDGDLEALNGRILCRTPSGLLQLDIAPTSSRIDVNLAQEPLLSALFIELGAEPGDAEHYAALIADYRDGDDMARPHGGENQAYERAGLAYGPKNNPLDTVAEVAALPDMPAWLYQRAYPYLTTRGLQSPDRTYAEQPILRAVEMSADLADRSVPAETSPGRTGRIDSRTLSRPLPSANQNNLRGAPLRIRAAAKADAGGFYVADAEMIGANNGKSVPRIVRIDEGSVRPTDFENQSGEAPGACSKWTSG